MPAGDEVGERLDEGAQVFLSVEAGDAADDRIGLGPPQSRPRCPPVWPVIQHKRVDPVDDDPELPREDDAGFQTFPAVGFGDADDPIGRRPEQSVHGPIRKSLYTVLEVQVVDAVQRVDGPDRKPQTRDPDPEAGDTSVTVYDPVSVPGDKAPDLAQESPRDTVREGEGMKRDASRLEPTHERATRPGSHFDGEPVGRKTGRQGEKLGLAAP